MLNTIPRISTPLLGLLVLLGLAGSTGRAAGPAFNEYEVKAAFLFNFTQFVDWPAAAFPTDTNPIRIGVLGEDPFGGVLEQTVRDETVRGRRLVIVRSKRVEDVKDCHVLFIARSEKPRLGQIRAVVADRPVLTVSDWKEHQPHGGIINFFLEGNKIRFEIDPTAAERASLKISSKLLNLGKVAGRAFGAERG